MNYRKHANTSPQPHRPKYLGLYRGLAIHENAGVFFAIRQEDESTFHHSNDLRHLKAVVAQHHARTPTNTDMEDG